MASKDKILDEIRTYEHDVRTSESRLKQLKEDLTERIDGTAEAEEVGRLKDQLKIAQENMKQVLRRNPEVNDLMEEIGAEAEVLKGAKFALSNHLVAYSMLTQERQVEMDDEGHSRDVLLSAKLSKDEKNYQTSLIKPENTELLDAVDEFNNTNPNATVTVKGKK
jgi:predicted  nucleic acid-binding Zn-ribbon protein